ncbi:MAG TPA: DoxX family protein [Patescibacteria group bacterium]|nr:DoxX family protein [Patescibacteria group bacterium]
MAQSDELFPEPFLSKWLFATPYFSWLWLLFRLYVGWEWLVAGYEKSTSSVWVGQQAGTALTGFLMGALKKTDGAHPDVSGWYGWFLQQVVLPNAATFSHMVAYGEVLVGVALILGVFTGIAAFFGAFMNMNYLFAGTVSVNPLLFLLELFLILAWRVAGWYGLDRWLLPLLGTPWKPGKLFKK